MWAGSGAGLKICGSLWQGRARVGQYQERGVASPPMADAPPTPPSMPSAAAMKAVSRFGRAGAGGAAAPDVSRLGSDVSADGEGGWWEARADYEIVVSQGGSPQSRIANSMNADLDLDLDL